LAVLAAGLLAATPLRAADAKADSSLKLVPADAAFYSTSLHNREQIEAIVNSKAWAKLRDLPAVQLVLKKAREEMTKAGGPMQQFNDFRKDPQNQQLLELVGDMVAHEIFVYGAEDTAGLFDLLGRINDASMQVFMQGAINKDTGPKAGEQQAKAMLKALSEHPDLIRVPGLVFGFKVTKTDIAEQQIKRLQGLLQPQLEHNPQLKGRLKRTKIGGHQFLTLTLDGKMVPWDKVALEKYEGTAGEFDKLIAKLKEFTITFSLGVRDGYLVFAVGPSTDPVAKFGQSDSLAGRDELKMLDQHAGKRITDISYISKAMNAKIQATQNNFVGLADKARDYVKNSSLPDELKKKIDQDLTDMAKDLQAYVREAGSVVSFSFSTPRGEESFTFDWGEHPAADGSKPLTLLHHAGGAPLLATAGRAKYNPDNYAKLVKWVKKAHGYVDEYVVPTLPDNTKDQYKQFTELAYPLLKRLDEATGKMLLPALKDGQSAFVIDAKLKSKQWFAGMPESKQELPLLEPAFVFGVSDAGLLRKAFEEYRGIINDTLGVINNQTGGFLPDLKLPPPQAKKAKGGTLYFYPLPNQLVGLDERIVLNAGLGKNVAMLSLSLEHSERLLADHPLKANSPLLADLKKPLAGATYCDWAGFVDALSPWVDFALQQASFPEDLPFDKQSIIKQVRTVLDVLKVIRTYSSITYFDGKVLVTHSETIIKDID
jgi:hypothetical protein